MNANTCVTDTGIREVFTGNAVQDDIKYRHCRVARFTDRSVIDSYHDHPDHRHLSNSHFRPYAGGRFSIDYEAP